MKQQERARTNTFEKPAKFKRDPLCAGVGAEHRVGLTEGEGPVGPGADGHAAGSGPAYRRCVALGIDV